MAGQWVPPLREEVAIELYRSLVVFVQTHPALEMTLEAHAVDSLSPSPWRGRAGEGGS